MADVAKGITDARSAGYKDEEIFQHLSAGEMGEKITAASKAGYSPTEILDHLSPKPKADKVASGDALQSARNKASDYLLGAADAGMQGITDARNSVVDAVGRMVSPESLRKRATEGPNYWQDAKDITNVALSPVTVPMAGLTGAGAELVGRPMAAAGGVVERAVGGDRTNEQLFQEMKPGVEMALQASMPRGYRAPVASAAPAPPPVPPPASAAPDFAKAPGLAQRALGAVKDAGMDYLKTGGPIIDMVLPGGGLVTTAAKRVLKGALKDKLGTAPAAAEATPVAPTAPVREGPRMMPWGGEMLPEVRASVPKAEVTTPQKLLDALNRQPNEIRPTAVEASPLPLAPKAVQNSLMAKVRAMNKAQRQPDPLASGALAQPPAGLPDELAAAMRAQNSLRPAAEPAAPPAMPTVPPAGPGAPVERAAGPSTPMAIKTAQFIRSRPTADVPIDPQLLEALRARQSIPAQAQPPAPPMAPQPTPPSPALATPEDLSIPDFLRRTPSKVTKKEGGEVKIETKPALGGYGGLPATSDTGGFGAAMMKGDKALVEFAQANGMSDAAVQAQIESMYASQVLAAQRVKKYMDAKASITKSPVAEATATATEDRYGALRKAYEGVKEKTNPIYNANNDVLRLKTNTATKDMDARAAAEHYADMQEARGVPFRNGRESFVKYVEEKQQQKIPMANELADATRIDPDYMLQHIRSIANFDEAVKFKESLKRFRPDDKAAIEAAMPDDLMVSTWPKINPRKNGAAPKAKSSRRSKKPPLSIQPTAL